MPNRSRKEYQVIASVNNGARAYFPPGKGCTGKVEKRSNRPACPATASAITYPANPVKATPCPEKPPAARTLGPTRLSIGKRCMVIPRVPPQ